MLIQRITLCKLFLPTNLPTCTPTIIYSLLLTNFYWILLQLQQNTSHTRQILRRSRCRFRIEFAIAGNLFPLVSWLGSISIRHISCFRFSKVWKSKRKNKYIIRIDKTYVNVKNPRSKRILWVISTFINNIDLQTRCVL